MKKILLLFATFIFCNVMWASHISGVNISYECVGGQQYLITVNLFRDCQDQNFLPAQLNVFIHSSCNNIGYVQFPQIELNEVSQLCPAQLPNSTCNGGLQPGVQMGIYQTTVQLPPCADWRIIVSEQNRDAAIVNLQNPEQFSLHTEAFLNNVAGSCNDSPVLSLLNLPNICVGTELFYNLGFVENQGDSLSYSLVSAQASNTPVSPFNIDYVGAYSGAQPMIGMTIDPINGQIVVTPATLGRFNAVIEVKEFRNGTHIGTVHYDFLFLVNACPTPPPEPELNSLTHVSGGGYPLSQNTIGICAEDDFCFEMSFFSPDPNINVDLKSNLNYLIPGATETVTGTNPATIRFCGTLPPGFDGGSFIIVANDDACPVYRQNFYTIDFEFREPLAATGTATVCKGESTTISAINDTVYTWYTLSGNVYSPGDDFSCNPCKSPEATPDTSTFYVVVGQYANSSCSNTDTVHLEVPLALEFEVLDETCMGNNGSIEIIVLTGSGDYSFNWQDIGPGPPVRIGLEAGEYHVSITDNVHNCTRNEVFTVIKLPPPNANAGEDFEMCGLSANMSAIPSYGTPLWIPVNGAVFENPADKNTEVTVNQEGIYEFVWTENAGGPQCFSSDTVKVRFYANPIVDIQAPDSICGLEISLEADVNVGTLQWNSLQNVEFENPHQATTTAAAEEYGEAQIYINVQNGICSVSDTVNVQFIEQPVANAGIDQNVCGSFAQIQAVDALGMGIWILPDGISTSDPPENTNIEITAQHYGTFELVRQLSHMNYCVDTDTIPIRFTEIPTVDLHGDKIVCDSVVEIEFDLPIGDLEWETSNGLIHSSNVESPQIMNGNYGTYTAILHADNGYGCTNSDTIEVHFIVQPQFEAATADTVCGLEYVLNGSLIGENHYWLQPNNAVISDLNNHQATVTAGDEGNFNFYWVAQNGGVCRDTLTYPVVFYHQPQTVAGEDQIVCGLSTQLNATASHGILLWHDQPGLTFSNQLNANAGVEAEWYYSYNVIVQEINGICTNLDSLTIEFIRPPSILNPQWECTGTDAQFILSFDVALHDSSQFQIDGIEGQLNNFHFISQPLPSNAPIEVILDNLGYCNPDTLSGTHFCPVLTFAGLMETDTIRLCGDALVSAAPSSGAFLDGNDTLLYAFHDGSGAQLGNVFGWNHEPNFIFTDVLDFTQTYFISAVAGNATDTGIDLNDPFLSISAGTPVEFYQLPSAVITGAISACPYDTVFLPVAVEGDLPLQLSYTIGNTAYDTIVNDYDFNLHIPDSGTVALVSVSSEFCDGNVLGVVGVEYFEIPGMTIDFPGEICDGDSAWVVLHFTGESPFLGEIFRDGDFYESFNTEMDSIGFFTLLGGEFSVEGFQDKNCSFSEIPVGFLNVKPMPEIDFVNEVSICSGDTVTLGDNALHGQIYNWNYNPALLQTNTATVQYVGVGNSPFTQLDVVVVHVERNGCFDSDTILVSVNPLPQPQIIGNNTVCSGDSVWFLGYGGHTYAWSPEGSFANFQGPGAMFFSDYNVEIELTATSAEGCEASISKQIEILEKPEAVFVVSGVAGCAPFDVEFLALNHQPGNQYTWSIPGGKGVEDSEYLHITFPEEGNYSAALTVKSANGCTHTELLSQFIEVYSTWADFDYFPKTPDINKPEVYLSGHSPKGTTTTWYLDTMVIGKTASTKYLFPAYIGGSYKLCFEVVSEQSCVARSCKTIKIKDDLEIYIPNTFTPNGDGLNDLFYPVLSNVDVPEYKFWITDPRGRIVFSTTDINEKWDGSTGTQGGEKYYGENKIYTWHLRAKPWFNVETRYYTGHVLLLR